MVFTTHGIILGIPLGVVIIMVIITLTMEVDTILVAAITQEVEEVELLLRKEFTDQGVATQHLYVLMEAQLSAVAVLHATKHPPFKTPLPIHTAGVKVPIPMKIQE